MSLARPPRLVILTTLAALGCASRPSRPADRNPSGIDSLIGAGERLFDSERFDSARRVWTIALDRTGTTGDSTAATRVLGWLSLVAWQQGDLGPARDFARRSLGLGLGTRDSALGTRRVEGGGADVGRAHLVLGLVALGDDDREAITHFDSAAVAARGGADTAMIARAMGGMGLGYAYLGDLARAREYQRSQRSLAQRIGNLRLEGNGVLNEAMIDILAGDPRPAMARIDTARSLYRRGHYAVGEQHALGQLATAYELTGEDHRVLETLDSALAIDRRLGLKEQEADELRLLGGAHLRLGDYRRALEHYEAAAILMRSGRFEANLAAVLRGEAQVHLRLGNRAKAGHAIDEATRLDAASEEPAGQLEDLLLTVEIAEQDHGRVAAAARLAEARTLARTIGTRDAAVAVLLAEMALADRANDPRAVLRSAAAGRALMTDHDDWRALGLAARAHARLGSLDSALAVGRRAVAAIERVRAGLATDALRANYVADRASVYADLVVALLRAGRPAEAFAVADGARSRGLLERLSESRANPNEPLADLRASEQLLHRIDSLIQRIRETDRVRTPERAGDAVPDNAPLAAELATARGEYEALVARAAQRTPLVVGVLGLGRVSSDQVRSALEPDQALVQYLITADQLVTFVVTRDSLRVFQAALSPANLTERTRLVRDLWGGPGTDWRLGLPAAHALYAALVGPARRAGALDGIRRLVFVPHGILAQVPFAALQDETTNRFLIEDFGVTQVPSAGAFAAMRRDQATRPAAPMPGMGLAPFPDELPATRAEITGIKAAFPGTEVRVGSAATERAVRRALEQPGFVHLASHGVLNTRNPLFSGMELARSIGEPEGDGRLEAHEILRLRIRSWLVFFSGCETGAIRGWTDDPVWGTADLTLAQAVLAAGAENVIMTLWRIDDAGAASFAEAFYRNLSRERLDDAFVTAQRATLADARFVSPYYWASYVLSGTGAAPAR